MFCSRLLLASLSVDVDFVEWYPMHLVQAEDDVAQPFLKISLPNCEFDYSTSCLTILSIC